MIKSWTINFNYSFNSTFYEKRDFSDAYLQFKDFTFEIEYAVVDKFSSHIIQIMAINLQMGQSSLYFGQNPPQILKLVAFLFNDLQWLYMFAINHLSRPLLNLGLLFLTPQIGVPIFGDYSLDMTIQKSLEMTEKQTDTYFRAEVFNSKKGIRAKLPVPADLSKVKGMESPDLEFMMNNQLFQSFFGVLDESKDLVLTLTDAMVFNLTQFLHLRTSDFKYYIPGLNKWGDRLMTVEVTKDTVLPKLTIGEKPGEIWLEGSSLCNFIVDGHGSQIVLSMGLLVGLKATVEKMAATAQILNITLTKLEIKDIKEIEKPNVESMLKEFRILYKMIMNAVNTLALEKPIAIPNKIALPIGATLNIKDVFLNILAGVMDMGVQLNFTD